MRAKKKWLIPLGILLIVSIVCAFLFINFDMAQRKRMAELEFSSKNVYVYNLTNEKEVLDIKGDEKVYPASLTKIMTVLLSVENAGDLSAVAPVDKATYQDMVAQNASMAGFYGNEPTTYMDLIYGTMLSSGGECANSLAINISGDVSKFVDAMNTRAHSLELENTHFNNPEGMDEDNHYSTAKDVALLLGEALGNKEFKDVFYSKEYVSTETLDHPTGVVIKSTVLSELEDKSQDGFEVLGGKSGTTEKAGHCWATVIEKNDEKYVCVVMGSESEEGRISDTLNIGKAL